MQPITPSLTPQEPRDDCPPACFVRVTGEQAGRFVEFEFAVGDPALSIEMILPRGAFDEFCARHGAVRLSDDMARRLDIDRMKWRFGAPGIDE